MWCKTTKIYCLVVLEVRSPKSLSVASNQSIGEAVASSESFTGRYVSLPFPAAYSPWLVALHYSSFCFHCIASSLSLLPLSDCLLSLWVFCPYLCDDIVPIQIIQDNLSIFKCLIIFAKILFPYNIHRLQELGNKYPFRRKNIFSWPQLSRHQADFISIFQTQKNSW